MNNFGLTEARNPYLDANSLLQGAAGDTSSSPAVIPLLDGTFSVLANDPIVPDQDLPPDTSELPSDASELPPDDSQPASDDIVVPPDAFSSFFRNGFVLPSPEPQALSLPVTATVIPQEPVVPISVPVSSETPNFSQRSQPYSINGNAPSLSVQAPPSLPPKSDAVHPPNVIAFPLQNSMLPSSDANTFSTTKSFTPPPGAQVQPQVNNFNGPMTGTTFSSVGRGTPSLQLMLTSTTTTVLPTMQNRGTPFSTTGGTIDVSGSDNVLARTSNVQFASPLSDLFNGIPPLALQPSYATSGEQQRRTVLLNGAPVVIRSDGYRSIITPIANLTQVEPLGSGNGQLRSGEQLYDVQVQGFEGNHILVPSSQIGVLSTDVNEAESAFQKLSKSAQTNISPQQKTTVLFKPERKTVNPLEQNEDFGRSSTIPSRNVFFEGLSVDTAAQPAASEDDNFFFARLIGLNPENKTPVAAGADSDTKPTERKATFSEKESIDNEERPGALVLKENLAPEVQKILAFLLPEQVGQNLLPYDPYTVPSEKFAPSTIPALNVPVSIYERAGNCGTL